MYPDDSPLRILANQSDRLRPLTRAAAILATLGLGISCVVANPAWGADSPRPSAANPLPQSYAAPNLAVVTAAGNQDDAGSVSDGAGGAIITWLDHRGGADEIYAQHVLATGSIDPAWPANGARLSVGAGAALVTASATDGAGGAIVVWEDGTTTEVRAQHVRSTGVADPAWGPTGIAVTTSASSLKLPRVISDGSGGAFVTWQDSRNGGTNLDIFAMHLRSAGLDPAWPVNGLAVCTASGNQRIPYLCTDGATGAIIAWSDLRTAANSFDIYAQHVLVSGIVDPAWPINGAVVVARTDNQRLYAALGSFIVLTSMAEDQANVIIPDGAGGCLITWTEGTSGSDIFVQRLRSSGTVDPPWASGGLAVCSAAGDQVMSHLVPDGTGGAIVTWVDARTGWANGFAEIYVQHVLNSGAMSGPTNGMAIATGGTATYPMEVADGAGGMFAFWEDDRDSVATARDVYTTHVLTSPSLAVEPGWPAGGAAVSTALHEQSLVRPVWNGAAGAIAAWIDTRTVATGDDIYAAFACLSAGTYYRDADADGYGDAAVSLVVCPGPPVGYVANHTDCDDGNPAVHPGATEVCDGLDNDCNGQADEIAHAPGLVSWWPGNGNANDATGNNGGTLGGTATFAPGIVGQAFSFDGAGYVDNIGTTGSFSFIQNTGAFTIESWINLNDPAALLQQAITANTSTSNERGHFFIWENSAGEQRLRLALMKAVAGVPVIESTSPAHVITTTGWHHVAAVGNGTNITFYVDGAAQPGSGVMGTMPSGASNRTLNLGRCPSSSPECHFNGRIDEPAIYNRALSGSEIQAIVAAGSGGRCALVDVTDFSPSTGRLEFAPPWPNPAARAINLEFQLPAIAHVRADVVDIAGRRVSPVLEDGVLAAGPHRLRWDGRGPSGHRVAPGVYLVRISSDAAVALRQIVVIR